MLPLNIQQQVYTDQIQSPHILRQKMNAIYGFSPVEEILLTVKTVFNIIFFSLLREIKWPQSGAKETRGV